MIDWARASCAGVQEWAELGWAGSLEKVTGIGRHQGNGSPWEPSWKNDECLFSGEIVHYFYLTFRGVHVLTKGQELQLTNLCDLS